MVSYNPRGKIQRVKYLENRERRRLQRQARREGRRRHRRALQRIINNDFDIDLVDAVLNNGLYQ